MRWSTRFCVTLAKPLNLFGGLVAGSGHESLHLADRFGQIRQRGVEIGPAVVEHAGERGEPVLELHDLLLAVAQRGDEGLQILDDVDDVAAAVGEDPATPDSWASVCRSLSPLPSNALAALSMNRDDRRCRTRCWSDPTPLPGA